LLVASTASAMDNHWVVAEASSGRNLRAITKAKNQRIQQTIPICYTMRYSISNALLIAPILVGTMLTGCVSSQKELEAVNKDWNRLIRASHIYPIYPLTQDIQPGDIFLTDTHVEDTKAWGKAGYLKFDRHITRLYPTNYAAFYERSFDTGIEDLPRLWLGDNSWTNSPVAAFPTYSFSVKQGGGANVSLPISGIPIGLGLMGAKSAQGYVAIGNAHTYGIDEASLTAQVAAYVTSHQADLIRCLNTQPIDDTARKNRVTPRYYLQAVSRVFLTGKVTISMVNDSSRGGTLSGGTPKDVPIPDITATNASSNYSNLITAVNTNLSTFTAAANAAGGVLPGGTIKFAAVSSRSVAMSEIFERPVVIGYLAISWPLTLTEVRGAAAGAPRIRVEVDSNGPVSLSLDEFFNRTK
jgi:hypothetical protein